MKSVLNDVEEVFFSPIINKMRKVLNKTNFVLDKNYKSDIIIDAVYGSMCHNIEETK